MDGWNIEKKHVFRFCFFFVFFPNVCFPFYKCSVNAKAKIQKRLNVIFAFFLSFKFSFVVFFVCVLGLRLESGFIWFDLIFFCLFVLVICFYLYLCGLKRLCEIGCLHIFCFVSKWNMNLFVKRRKTMVGVGSVSVACACFGNKNCVCFEILLFLRKVGCEYHNKIK